MEQPLAERSGFIQARCASDVGLQREIEQLLAAHTDASFLEHSPTRVDASQLR